MHLPKLLLAALLLTTSLLVGVHATPATAGVPVLVIDGRGFGHGVGLSQWGAEGMARDGYTTEQILATFYPGTALGTTTGDVRVAVHSATGPVTLAFPQGGEVRSAPGGTQAPGFPVQVGPGGQVRVWYDGSYRAEALFVGQSAAAAPYQDCSVVVVCEPDDEPDDPEEPPAPPPTTTTTTAPPEPTTPPDDGDDDAPPPDRPSDDDESDESTGHDGGSGDAGSGGTTPTTAAPRPAPGSSSPDQAPAPDPAEQPADTVAPTPPTVAGPPSSSTPLWAVPTMGGATTVAERGRTYRGALEVLAASGGVRVVNQVDVETYVKGMAEVPGTWPAAAIEAQSVAARTYALRAMQASGELCDDQRCQVYVGVAGENAGQSAAVDATSGWALVYGGEFASTVYSSDAGGYSATTEEGFGTPDGVYPYLQAVDYPDAIDAPAPWHVEVGLGDVGARFGYPGEVTGARIADTGPSGRALAVELLGNAGPRRVPGREFASAMGLKSTLFELSSGAADVAPVAPQAAELQAMPDEAGKLARQPNAATHPRRGAADPSGRPSRAQRVELVESITSTARHMLRTTTGPVPSSRPTSPVPAAIAAALAIAAVTAAGLSRRDVRRRLLAVTPGRGDSSGERATLREWLPRRLRRTPPDPLP